MRLISALRGLALLLLASLGLVACAELAPSTTARTRIAEVALERGDYPRAVDEYRQVAEASRDAKKSEHAARVAFEHSQFSALAAIARGWLSRDPHNELAHRFLAVASLELDDRVGAERELEVLVHTAYVSPGDAFDALAESLADLHNAVGVAATMRHLAEAYPALPQANLAAASLLLAAGQATDARRFAERVLVLNSQSRDARSLVARARVVGGDCDGGLAAQGALAKDGAGADRLVYAWLLVSCERGAEAEPYFLGLAATSPLKAEALEGLAGIDLEAGRWDRALTRYNEVLATGRNGDRARFGIAMVADRRHDLVLAQQHYQRVTQGPRMVAAQLRSYRLLLDLGRPDEAARTLDAFVESVPERQVELTAGRAQVLSTLGRFDDAIHLLERAERSYPERTELAYALAVVLEQSGQVDRALDVLRALRHRRPLDPTAANALGFTLADHARQLPEAERLIRFALAQSPDSAAIQDSLGWVLFRRGHPREAVEWLRVAYHLERDAEIARHLGEVRWALGEHAEALRIWREALALAPEDAALGQLVTEHAQP